MALRLSQKKTTILNLDPAEAAYLFHNDGCYKFTGKTISELNDSNLAKNAWALLDSPRPGTFPNPIFTSEYSRVYMVYASSPNNLRYKHLIKQNNCRIAVMRAWSFPEIWVGSVKEFWLMPNVPAVTNPINRTTLRKRQPSEGDRELLREQFLKYGPSPRTMLTLYDRAQTTQDLDEQIDAAIKKIKMSTLPELVEIAKGEGSAKAIDQQISHSVILVYPHPGRRSSIRADVISHHVFQLIADRLFVRGFEELVNTYRLFRDVDELSVSAGWAFEFYATGCWQINMVVFSI